MASKCNFPGFTFSFSFPIPIPGFPALPSFGWHPSFAMPPCPLD